MPYYDYSCVTCGSKFEVFQHMDEEPLVERVHVNNSKFAYCHGPVERLISVPSLRFVGKGFYVNDYPKNGSC
jgi:predicted nucleic acid-binding Zn ribbon protein